MKRTRKKPTKRLAGVPVHAARLVVAEIVYDDEPVCKAVLIDAAAHALEEAEPGPDHTFRYLTVPPKACPVDVLWQIWITKQIGLTSGSLWGYHWKLVLDQ